MDDYNVVPWPDCIYLGCIYNYKSPRMHLPEESCLLLSSTSSCISLTSTLTLTHLRMRHKDLEDLPLVFLQTHGCVRKLKNVYLFGWRPE